MKVFSIYKATNKVNGKSYIGRTTSELKKRIYWHYSNAKKRTHKNNPFFDALLMGDRSDWDWEVLQTTSSLQESYKLETFFINEYNAIENGYNTKDSDLTPWNKGKEMNESYRENLRGENNPMFGKSHSEEYRKWRSEHMSKVQLGDKNHTARKVYCIELDKTWNTVKEVAQELGVHKDSISNNCRGITKSAGGLHFQYVDKKNKVIESKLVGGSNPKARKVACIELNKQWDTVKECAEEIGVTPQAISKVCRGVNKTAKNLHFKYI